MRLRRTASASSVFVALAIVVTMCGAPAQKPAAPVENQAAPAEQPADSVGGMDKTIR